MSFISNPKNLTVPEESFYSIDRLWLFDQHDRKSWEQAFGEQAPPFDAARAPKRWADTSVLAGVSDPDSASVEYQYFDNGSRSFKKIKMSVREAAAPNLTGAYIYPEFVLTPTAAVLVNTRNGQESPFNPKMLCHRSEADQLAKEIGGDSVIESGYSPDGPFQEDWRGEERRIWQIRRGNKYHSAALLLAQKYKKGVGAPGQWVINDSGDPTWASTVQETGERNARPSVPMPCRALAGNEALYLGHPMKVVIFRTDKESEFNPKEAAGSFPPDLRSVIERIDANLQQLLALSFVNPE